VLVNARLKLTEHVWFQESDTLLGVIQGLLKRKNRFPVGGVMVMLFVPLLVVVV
jgi:hypothetical protein